MKAGVTESRRRREAAKAAEEAKAPAEKSKLSLLARLIRSPNKANAQALVRSASQGELTTHDMQAGIAALLASAGEHAKAARSGDVPARRGDANETARAFLVLQKQLIEGLKDVVLAAPSSGGPMIVTELHWPPLYAGDDPGEAVRTKVPDGMEV